MIIRNDNITEASISTENNASIFLSQVGAAGGRVTPTIINAVTNLFDDLRANGLWDKIYAFYPMVGGTTASCRIEAKGTTDYSLIYVGGISTTIDGITGISGCGIANTPMTTIFDNANNAHMCYYSRTSRAANQSFSVGVVIGGVEDNNQKRFQLNILYDTNTYVVIGNLDSAVSYADTGTTGFYIGSRTSQSSIKLYKNGTMVAQNTTSTTNALNPNGPSLLGGLDAAYPGGNPGASDGLQCAFFGFGLGFTDAEASTYYNIVQTFQTSLSRQV